MNKKWEIEKIRIIRKIRNVFSIIIGIPIALMIISEVTGIGKKEGGYKVYEAYSPFKEGQDLIMHNNIKLVAMNVESIAFIDLWKNDTFFAYDVIHKDFYLYENIKYVKVPKEVVSKYNITARFSWVEKFGKFIILVLIIIFIIISLFERYGYIFW